MDASLKRALLLAAIALVLAAPLAAADHVFSHRAVVVGRVVGSDGVPVAGAVVLAKFSSLNATARCFDVRAEVTGPQGDFVVCRHTHAMPEGDVTVNLSVQGESIEVPFDKILRRSHVLLRLQAPAATHDVGGVRAFARTAHVEGRVFALGDTEVEGVKVNGTPLGGRNVTVQLFAPQEPDPRAQRNATTNEHGDYSVDLDATSIPNGSRIFVTSGALAGIAMLDPFFRRADVDIVSPAPEAIIERPGTGDVRVPGIGAFSAVAVAALAAALSRRA